MSVLYKLFLVILFLGPLSGLFQGLLFITFDFGADFIASVPSKLFLVILFLGPLSGLF
ncbi:uncharacterized protein DS421_4g132660 [Arachis hypogaea]|nr:uncharacterized protein DS421_4g132660 [Arachis hypogaea]